MSRWGGAEAGDGVSSAARGARARAPPVAPPRPPQLRLLLIYVATHPGRMDAAKEAQWAKLARLPPTDVARAFAGLEALGVPVYRKPGVAWAKPPKRKPAATAGGFEVGGVAPAVGDWFDALAAGTLDDAAFPHVVPPDDAEPGAPPLGGAPSRLASLAGGLGASGRTGSVRTAHSTAGWAARAGARGGGKGRPMVVFIAGGVTRGEAAAAAAAAARHGRPCVVAGSGLLTGASFLDGLKELGGLDYSHEA